MLTYRQQRGILKIVADSQHAGIRCGISRRAGYARDMKGHDRPRQRRREGLPGRVQAARLTGEGARAGLFAAIAIYIRRK